MLRTYMNKLRWLLPIFCCGAFVSVASSCSGLTQLGGQSIGETFADENVAALVKAAVAGKADKVAQLAAAGVNVNAVGNNGATPLVWALNARNHQGVEALLRAGADPNLLTEKLGIAPMYFISMGDDSDLLRLLLKYGGNPNHEGRGRIDERPLSQAASEGRIENIKLLLEAGADINAHDEFGESAATATLALAKFEATAFLLERGYSYNLSYLARGVKIIQVPPNSDAQRWKDRVIVMLKERGVEVQQ